MIMALIKSLPKYDSLNVKAKQQRLISITNENIF